jgi:hypothetical protein
MQLWDVQTGKEIRRLEGQRDECNVLAGRSLDRIRGLGRNRPALRRKNRQGDPTIRKGHRRSQEGAPAGQRLQRRCELRRVLVGQSLGRIQRHSRNRRALGCANWQGD